MAWKKSILSSVFSGVSPQSGVILGMVLLAGWVVVGTLGYLLIEDGYTLVEAFYMTIITVSTVGYREVHPLSPVGQIFTTMVVLVGLALLLYTLSRLAQVLFEGELVDILGKRRMMNEIADLRDHFVVCGFGKVGRPVAEGLARHGLPMVVVDRNPDVAGALQDEGFLHLIGDATEEMTIEKAGVANARTLFALLSSDADNLYLTMAAKDLNPKLKVIARAVDPEGETRLKRGGADVVVSPAKIAGLRVLQAAVNPTAMEFMEIVTGQQALQLSMADIPVSERSGLVGESISEAGVRGAFGVIIVAVKRLDGMIFNPDSAHRISAGDILVVLGEDLEIAQLQEACK